MSLHYIFSDNRENLSDSPSEFTHSITLPAHHNRISLVSISIPKSFYLVNAPFNTFKMDSTTHSIAEGNYSVEQFVSAVNAQITPATLTFSRQTGKMTFASTATTFQVPTGSNLYRQLGFDENTIYTFDNGTLESPNVVNFQPLAECYILSDLVSDSTAYYHNLISTVYFNTSPDWSFVNFVNPQIEATGKPLALNPSGQNNDRSTTYQFTATFKLLDQIGDIVDLNGLGFRMVLKTWREENLFQLMKGYIDLQIALIQKAEVETAMRSAP